MNFLSGFTPLSMICLLYSFRYIFHAFLFNIRNYLPELKNIQRCKAVLNITIPRVNNLSIKPKIAWNICFILYPKHKITQTLQIISKSIEFELCHMKVTTLKVDQRTNHETCFR